MLVVTVPSKKLTIKSLVIILPYKKVSIIRYLLLFHVKSNNFVNRYFSHTKYVSLTLIVTNPHTKYNVEQSVGWLKVRTLLTIFKSRWTAPLKYRQNHYFVTVKKKKITSLDR